jgi:FAD:protein FMN transferase
MPWNRNTAAALILLVAAVSLASNDSPPPSPLHKQKYAMGTVFEIVAYDTADHQAALAIDHAFQEIVRLDSVMSNYTPDSELSRLNRTAPFHSQLVSHDLYRVIEQSLPYSEISDGKFDISVGPLVDLWKAQLRGEHAVSAEEEKKARNCVGYKKILLLPPNQVEFLSPCLRIDLGSIGKGYAVDRAAEILRTHGIDGALISAGGSTIYAIGAPPGQSGWLVHLRDPSGHVSPEVLLKDSSVSTSGQTSASVLGNNPAGHIVDPQQGTPLKTSFAVSVVAHTATASDALSTTLLLLGPQAGKPAVQAMAGTAAVWISPDGDVESASNGARIAIRHNSQISDGVEHASSN